MSKVIGIDLGTTNSCVAVVEGGKPVVITNAEGERTTPSVVAFTKDGERLVGGAAKRQIATNSGRTISSIKRHMGSDYRVHIDGKDLTPQEISAMILTKIRRDAESYLGEPVTVSYRFRMTIPWSICKDFVFQPDSFSSSWRMTRSVSSSQLRAVSSPSFWRMRKPCFASASWASACLREIYCVSYWATRRQTCGI